MKTKSRFKNTPLLSQMNMIKLTCVVCVLILVSGCSFPFAIHTESLTSRGRAIFVDAKERMVISNFVESMDSRMLRVCSEPPPDVFSVFALRLDAEANVGVKAGSLTATLNQNAATIERTQTINILRESMYRTCERYMNNAISKDEFIVQAARDQRAMIAVLAIEQLTGVQKAAATILTATASAVSAGLSAEAITTLQKAQEAYTDLQAKAKAKREQADKLLPEIACDNKPLPEIVCDNKLLPENVCDNELPPEIACDNKLPPEIACDKLKEGTAKEVEKKKLELCKEAKDLEQQTVQAKAHYDTLKKAITQATAIVTRSEGRLAGTGQINQSPAPEHIANKIVEIVEDANNFDEILLTCVVLFRNLSSNSLKATQGNDQEKMKEFTTRCLSLIVAKMDTKIAKADTQIAKEKEKTAMYHERTVSMQYGHLIDELWEKLWEGDTKKTDSTRRFDELIKKAGLDARINKYRDSIHNEAIGSVDKKLFSRLISRALHPDLVQKLLEQE